MKTSQWPNIVNPNTRITPNLFYGNNYKEWIYLAMMAIQGAKRLGYIDERIKKLSKDDPKYPNWESENILIMNWTLNSMEENIAASFCHCDTVKELGFNQCHLCSEKITLESLFKEIAAVKEGDLSTGNY